MKPMPRLPRVLIASKGCSWDEKLVFPVPSLVLCLPLYQFLNQITESFVSFSGRQFHCNGFILCFIVYPLDRSLNHDCLTFKKYQCHA